MRDELEISPDPPATIDCPSGPVRRTERLDRTARITHHVAHRHPPTTRSLHGHAPDRHQLAGGRRRRRVRFRAGRHLVRPVVQERLVPRSRRRSRTPHRGIRRACSARAFVLRLLAAIAFAVPARPEARAARWACSAASLVGLAFVATSFGINYAFAQRSLKLWLIDGGYHILQFALYGLILGAVALKRHRRCSCAGTSTSSRPSPTCTGRR